MNTKKSFVCLILVLSLLLSVFAVGCDGSGSNGSGSKNSESGSTANSYKTPLENMEKYYNMRSREVEEAVKLMSCGYCQSEIEAIVKDFKNSELYDDLHEYINEDYEEKVTLKITGKEELTASDIKEFKISYIDTAAQKFSPYTENILDDPEYYAERYGIGTSKAKALANDIKNLCEKLENAEISKGYEIDYQITESDGSTKDHTTYVYCIDKKWVSRETFGASVNIVYKLIK